MLGPIVALLLLTSPAAGPVDQSNCWLLCTSPAPTTSNEPSLYDRLLGRDPESLQRRIETLERQQSPLYRDLLNPPSNSGGLFPSTSSRGCSATSSLLGNC